MIPKSLPVAIGPFALALILFAALVLITAGAPLAVGAESPANTLVGRVDGDPIYREDLHDKEIAETRQKLYDLERSSLREKSLALLREKHPGEFPVPKVTIREDDIRNFYKSADLGRQGTLEELEDRIRDYLEIRKLADIDELQYQTAFAQGYIESFLKPPQVYLVELANVDRAAVKGNETALVRIVEFSDFQCPFCNRARPVVQQVLEKYAGRVHLTYRHLPLDRIHPRARELAEAAECAADQGRFWPFHDTIFDNLDSLATADLTEFAGKAQVEDLKAFDACVRSHRFADRVEEDLRAADRLGIGGTPTFFIGRRGENGMLQGVLLEGAQPFKAFQDSIDRILAGESN